MKKAWQKPQLVVLTRGRPEESVLTACKIGDWATVGAGGFGKCVKQMRAKIVMISVPPSHCPLGQQEFVKEQTEGKRLALSLSTFSLSLIKEGKEK